MILVINSGSSTVKFAAYGTPALEPLLSGMAESLRTASASLKLKSQEGPAVIAIAEADHHQALDIIAAELLRRIPSCEIEAVGHRVVHGGEFFRQAVLIDDSVEARIQSLFTLAPLHNPPNLLGIQAMRRRFPGVLQVAVFDTAFHQSMPEQAFRYAIPETFYLQHGVRRYGAHGTSHRFVAEATAAALGRPLEELQLITAHLGNGCSGCAIRSGLSVETTMGLTPLEGMMMGTRSGDVDPALHQFLALNAGLSLTAITDLLTKQSGLLGVSGTTNDRRVLEAAMQRGDARARLALELFCYRAAKCLLALTAALDRVDALTFTGGIGENSAFIRRRIVEQMPLLGIELVEEANSANGARTGGQISRTDGKACLVIPTNEELAIARETVRMMPSPVGASGN